MSDPTSAVIHWLSAREHISEEVAGSRCRRRMTALQTGRHPCPLARDSAQRMSGPELALQRNVPRVTELLAALLGAVIGGALAFLAIRWQTQRVIDHETKRARDAAEDARNAARHAVSRMAVLELLRVLVDVERVIPDLGGVTAHPATTSSELDDRGSEAVQALDLLASANATQAPLLPDSIQRRCAHLHVLASDLHAARPVATDDAGRDDWTTTKVERARADVATYLAYVRRSLVALINEQDLPPEAAVPSLRRVDMSVWLAPDEGGPSLSERPPAGGSA